MPANVKCGQCGKSFNIAPKTSDKGGGVKETYFACPFCGEHYTAFYTDREIRKKQAEINRLWEQLKAAGDDKEKTAGLEKRIMDFKAEIKNDMEELKKRMQEKP